MCQTTVGGSNDSDLTDLLNAEARDEALSLLSRNTGEQSQVAMSVSSLNLAKALSALDLALPAQVVAASPQQLEGKGLSGYEALQRMKLDASRYRSAYSDWRRGAARGAKGEASFKAASGSGLPQQSSGPTGAAAPAAALPKAAAPASAPLPKAAAGAPRAAPHLTAATSGPLAAAAPSRRPPSTHNLTQLPMAINEEGEVLTVEYGGEEEEEEEATSPTGAAGGKGSWLKFSFNPYSEVAETEPRAPLPLCEANLPAIVAAGAGRSLSVPAPGSRTATAYIAHIGVGGFHRSHLAFVTDVLRQQQHTCAGGAPPVGVAGAEEAWGILGVGLMPWDAKMRDVLAKQDHMYSLLLRGNQSASARVVGSIVDFLFVPEAPEAALARLCAPDVRIISLTVTEKGYYRNVEGALDLASPLVREDLASWKAVDGGAKGLAAPKTAFGLICTVLQRRRLGGLGPLTVFSCDNLPMNGSVCKAVTLQFARAADPPLATWMEAHVSFPNSMVDRITPATEPEHKQLLRDEYAIEDQWPVIAEPFLQWVIEEAFVAGRPAWERALPQDVLVTANVEPYELMKLRLLNSSHSALSYAAMLCEYTFVDDALADPDVFAFLRAYMLEVVKTLSAVQGVDLGEYQRSLLERFSNIYIKDKLARLAQDGSQKFMNTLRDALLGYRTQRAAMLEVTAREPSWIAPRDKNTQEGTQYVALALAAFMRYVDSADEQGQPLPLDDPLAAQLRPFAAQAFRSGGGRPEAVRRAECIDATRMFLRTVFGAEVAAWDAFVETVWGHAEQLRRTSCRDVLRQCRHDQLRVLRAEVAEAEAQLKELRRCEQLLTTPSERDAALRFYRGDALPSQRIPRRQTFSN